MENKEMGQYKSDDVNKKEVKWGCKININKQSRIR